MTVLAAQLSPTLRDAVDCVASQALLSMGFYRQECQSELPALLQGIFLTQGSNPVLLHPRQILYHLSPWGPMMKSESEFAQLCPILCNSMDYSLSRSSIHGIFQA